MVASQILMKYWYIKTTTRAGPHDFFFILSTKQFQLSTHLINNCGVECAGPASPLWKAICSRVIQDNVGPEEINNKKAEYNGKAPQNSYIMLPCLWTVRDPDTCNKKLQSFSLPVLDRITKCALIFCKNTHFSLCVCSCACYILPPGVLFNVQRAF